MSRRALSELLIDDATWTTGSLERRREWRLAIEELLHEGVFELLAAAEGSHRAQVMLGPEAVALEVHAPDGRLAAREEVPLLSLRPLMDDYMGTCREMGKLVSSKNSPRLEALDIAKRIVHDEAGELLVGLLTTLRPDHATARRLFTLLLTLVHDTTRLAGTSHRERL